MPKNTRLFLLVVLFISLILLVKTNFTSKNKDTKNNIESGELYTIAELPNGQKAEFELYMKGKASTPQKAIIYVEKLINGETKRKLPLRVEVFENTTENKKKIYTYEARYPEITTDLVVASTAPGFIDMDKDALFIQRRTAEHKIDTNDYLTFIAFYSENNTVGQFKVLDGPTITDLDKYKIMSGFGSVMIARALYETDPAIAKLTDLHKYEYVKYSWLWDKFVESPPIVTTRYKYSNDLHICDIADKEGFRYKLMPRPQ